MSDSEPNEVDRGVDESMRMFEKSKVGDAPALQPIKPARVLLVLDGSSQDKASVAAAGFLRQTFNVETLVFADVDLELLRRHRYSGTVQPWSDRRTDLFSVSWEGGDGGEPDRV